MYCAIGFGWQASLASKMTMPSFRLDEPSREKTPYFPSSVVITSLTSRASVIIESTIRGARGSETSMAYTRSEMVVR